MAKESDVVILYEKLSDKVVVADVIVNVGNAELPVNCPCVISEGNELEPDDYEILLLTTEERAILPDWWKDSLTRETIIVEPLPIRAAGDQTS